MLNTECINRSCPPGSFGGARCVCRKCTERRRYEQELENVIKKHTKCPCCGARDGV